MEEAGPGVFVYDSFFSLSADGGGIFLDKARERVLR
jgi:hypothetical protein